MTSDIWQRSDLVCNAFRWAALGGATAMRRRLSDLSLGTGGGQSSQWRSEAEPDGAKT